MKPVHYLLPLAAPGAMGVLLYQRLQPVVITAAPVNSIGLGDPARSLLLVTGTPGLFEKSQGGIAYTGYLLSELAARDPKAAFLHWDQLKTEHPGLLDYQTPEAAAAFAARHHLDD